MSSYQKDNKTEFGTTNHRVPESDFYSEVEALIQSLKNNQRCYAEASSLVNSSELRNFFEIVELERTIAMEIIAKSIGRLDLILGRSSHSADVVWFASIEFNGKSKAEFDREILARCIRCEDALYQAYSDAISSKDDKQQFRILDSQLVRLQKVQIKLLQLEEKFSKNRKI